MSEERAVQGHLCWNEEVKPMINSKPIARRKLILPDQGFKLHSYLLAICKGKIRINTHYWWWYKAKLEFGFQCCTRKNFEVDEARGMTD